MPSGSHPTVFCFYTYPHYNCNFLCSFPPISLSSLSESVLPVFTASISWVEPPLIRNIHRVSMWNAAYLKEVRTAIFAHILHFSPQEKLRIKSIAASRVQNIPNGVKCVHSWQTWQRARNKSALARNHLLLGQVITTTAKKIKKINNNNNDNMNKW